MAQSAFRRVRPLVIAVAMIWTSWACVTAFVVLVDPYDVRPWGASSTLMEGFDPFAMDRFLSIASKDPEADLVLIGTSPTTPYSPADLLRAYPEAERPWNVSLHGGLGVDRLVTMEAFAARSNAMHYLITVDFFLAARDQRSRPGFAFHLHNSSFVDDLRVVTPDAVADAVRVMRRGSPIADEEIARLAEADFNFRTARHWRQPERRLIHRRAARVGRGVIFSAGRTECSEFPGVATFMQSVTRLRERGARVDLLVPTYASALWFEWSVDRERLRELGPSMLEEQLAMRRCVVRLADTIGVAVYAQDDDARLINDLRNFRDPGHIQGEENLMAFITMPKNPESRLTPGSFDAYADRVRVGVQAFDPEATW